MHKNMAARVVLPQRMLPSLSHPASPSPPSREVLLVSRSRRPKQGALDAMMGLEKPALPLGPFLLCFCSDCRLGDLLVGTQLGAFTPLFFVRASAQSHVPGRHASGQA